MLELLSLDFGVMRWDHPILVLYQLKSCFRSREGILVLSLLQTLRPLRWRYINHISFLQILNTLLTERAEGFLMVKKTKTVKMRLASWRPWVLVSDCVWISENLASGAEPQYVPYAAPGRRLLRLKYFTIDSTCSFRGRTSTILCVLLLKMRSGAWTVSFV